MWKSMHRYLKYSSGIGSFHSILIQFRRYAKRQLRCNRPRHKYIWLMLLNSQSEAVKKPHCPGAACSKYWFLFNWEFIKALLCRLWFNCMYFAKLWVNSGLVWLGTIRADSVMLVKNRLSGEQSSTIMLRRMIQHVMIHITSPFSHTQQPTVSMCHLAWSTLNVCSISFQANSWSFAKCVEDPLLNRPELTTEYRCYHTDSSWLCNGAHWWWSQLFPWHQTVVLTGPSQWEVLTFTVHAINAANTTWECTLFVFLQDCVELLVIGCLEVLWTVEFDNMSHRKLQCS